MTLNINLRCSPGNTIDFHAVPVFLPYFALVNAHLFVGADIFSVLGIGSKSDALLIVMGNGNILNYYNML